MSKTISAVPESITRADYLSLIERFGFTPTDVSDLHLATDGVYATVLERDEAGSPRIEGESFVTNVVYIPVEG